MSLYFLFNLLFNIIRKNIGDLYGKNKKVLINNWLYVLIFISLLAFSIISILLNYPLEPGNMKISLDFYGNLVLWGTIIISLIYFILLAILGKKIK